MKRDILDLYYITALFIQIELIHLEGMGGSWETHKILCKLGCLHMSFIPGRRSKDPYQILIRSLKGCVNGGGLYLVREGIFYNFPLLLSMPLVLFFSNSSISFWTKNSCRKFFSHCFNDQCFVQVLCKFFRYPHSQGSGSQQRLSRATHLTLGIDLLVGSNCAQPKRQ